MRFLRLFLSIFTLLFYFNLSFAQNVGINTTSPTYLLDIRSTDDNIKGGELQLATPSESNFLRFFGGRLDDPNPFMAFHDLDTLHFVTTLPDFSTYKRRMTLFPDGKLGLGTDKPQSELDIRTNAVDDGSEIHLSNADASYFLRFFSGKPTNNKPAIFWNFESELDFARFDGNLNYKPFLRLDGKRIHVLNSGGSVYLGEDAGASDNTSSNAQTHNTTVGSFSLLNNINGIRNTVLGYRAGSGSNVGSSFSRNVLIGYEAGLNITASDKLYIENSSSATPLIYGEFNNNLLRVNGRQEVTGSLELNRGITSGVALSVNGQEALWSNGGYFSYGFGTSYNYFAKPIKIGPIDGSTVPYADLQIINNSASKDAIIALNSVSKDAIVSVVSANDAVIQLTDNNSEDSGWTIRRRSDNNLEWKYNNASKMRMTTLGNLGIGVTNPTKTLEIAGDSRIFKSINSQYPTPLFVASIENLSNTNTSLNNALKLVAGHDNFIGGMTAPIQPIFIGFYRPDGTTLGGIHQRSGNGLIFYELSDQRHKKEIKTTKTGINTLMQVKVRDYKWIDGDRNQSPTTGFIAQELFEVYPSAAKEGGSDSKSDPWQIAPTQLIPLMVKSTQDQQELIEELQDKNQVLEDRIERLERLLLKDK